MTPIQMEVAEALRDSAAGNEERDAVVAIIERRSAEAAARAVDEALSVDVAATWLHDNPAGEALHEDQWAMRFPAGTEGKGAECRPCRSVAAALAAHLRGPRP
jgi:hypothetical protein